MPSKKIKTTLIATSIASVLCGEAPPLYAGSVLEEVVVTARKREESLQETPVAISAMTGEQLANSGMQSGADLRAAVPNVDVYGGNGTSGAGSFFIRGVGARNTGPNYDSGVGIYLDGLYLSRADGAILDNVDIASLQVLRGPQGTLFGKNTTGGAILYATNKPTDKLAGNASVRVGNYNRRDGKVTVNVPLVDDLLNSRFSLFSTRRDGFVTNDYLNQKMSDEDRIGGQAHFLLLPSSDVQIDFNNFFSKVNQRERGQKCQVISGIPGAGWQSVAQDEFIIVPSTKRTIADSCRDNEVLGVDHVLSDMNPSQYFAESYMSGITVSWDIDDSLSFKSVSGFRGTRVRNTSDLDGTAIALLEGTPNGSSSHAQYTNQLSQEFQLSGSALDEKLNFVGGVFGFSEKTTTPNGYGITGPFFGALFDPNQAFLTSSQTKNGVANSSASVFAQADWKFDEQWSATAGIRYTRESRKLHRVQDVVDIATLDNDGSTVTVSNGSFYTFPNGPSSFNPTPDYIHAVKATGDIADINDQQTSIHDSAWTPMFSLQRNLEEVGFIETGSVYATVSKGFLSGGIADALDPITQKLPTYKPEKVTNYELGLKFDAFDRRLRVNTALFYLDYRDRQLTSVVISNDGGAAGIPINAAKSSIAGIEIESQFIPVDNLEITANLTFNHGEIEKFDDHRIVIPGSLPGSTCAPIHGGGLNVDYCDVDRSGENLPRLPKAIYFTAAQYTFHTEFGDIVPRVQWSLRTQIDNCFDRSSCVSGAYLGSQHDLGARLSWTSNDKRWGIAAYGNNLLDQRYIIGGTPLVDVTQTGGTIYNDPRMYGVETHFNW